MRVRLLEIENFRGITTGRVVFRQHTLLIGGNNIGKSTVCEALELVLGPERTSRRPVVDEHDFAGGRYLDDDGNSQDIRIRVVLTDLSDEQERRFQSHMRRWDDAELKFIDEEPGALEQADDEGVCWALPVVFIGRYDAEEDDFDGETFFDHPAPDLDDLDDETRAQIGAGRARFGRAHKRLCGFVFLRALRTGSRALSLHRGSLLDTILRFAGDGSAEMWSQTLTTLQDLDPAIGDIEQLQVIRSQIRERLGKFVNLADRDDSAAFFASDLTREHLRDVVRLFVATQPSEHLVPFVRQGTGSVNLLVFALLTIIADLKEDRSAIFVMEEPEIALPPHTQRRVTKYVLQQMGQSIVTSHSPYVIEQFGPEDVVILTRDEQAMTGSPIDTASVKPKTYKTNRRQFAEAILSRAVLVVEGLTELLCSLLHPQRSNGFARSMSTLTLPVCQSSMRRATVACRSSRRSLPLWANVCTARGISRTHRQRRPRRRTGSRSTAGGSLRRRRSRPSWLVRRRLQCCAASLTMCGSERTTRPKLRTTPLPQMPSYRQSRLKCSGIGRVITTGTEPC